MVVILCIRVFVKTTNLLNQKVKNLIERKLNQNRMKQYRVWLEDAMEEELGFWWYCYLDNNGCLQDYNYPDDMPDKLEWYIQNGYHVEEVSNG